MTQQVAIQELISKIQQKLDRTADVIQGDLLVKTADFRKFQEQWKLDIDALREAIKENNPQPAPRASNKLKVASLSESEKKHRELILRKWKSVLEAAHNQGEILDALSEGGELPATFVVNIKGATQAELDRDFKLETFKVQFASVKRNKKDEYKKEVKKGKGELLRMRRRNTRRQTKAAVRKVVAKGHADSIYKNHILPEYMSSEESDNEQLNVKELPWRSLDFAVYLHQLDKVYLEQQTGISKRLYKKREISTTPSSRGPPKYAPDHTIRQSDS